MDRSKKDWAQLGTTLTAETADPANAEKSLVALEASQADGNDSCASGVSDHDASVNSFWKQEGDHGPPLRCDENSNTPYKSLRQLTDTPTKGRLCCRT